MFKIIIWSANLLHSFAGARGEVKLPRFTPSFCDFSFRILRKTYALFTRYRIVFRVADTYSCPVKYKHLSDMRLSTLEIPCACAAQLRSFTEIASKAPFSCVNRSPIRHDFSAGAKAIQYSQSS